MRGLILGVGLALVMGTAAVAKDFIVVSSTDSSVKVGQSLDAGAHVNLGAGKSLTLMRPTGEIITVQAGANGTTLPGGGQASASDGKYTAVRALFEKPPAGRTFGARRGFCPGPEVLDNLEAIVKANQAGCKADARTAFLIYLKGHGVSEADATKLYDETVVTGEEDDASK